MDRTLVVGLTGPMGSGKTAVARLFADNGYKVVDADVIARKVVEKGSQTLVALQKVFGEDILTADGELDRRLLSQRAFSTKDNTKTLNNITHPAIIELVKSEILRFKEQGYTKIIYDAPLLFESGSDNLCDVVISVVADVDFRMARVKKRDSLNQEEIKKRFNAQHSDDFYIEKSDYVIYNNSSVDKLLCDTMMIISALDEVTNGTFCENR